MNILAIVNCVSKPRPGTSCSCVDTLRHKTYGLESPIGIMSISRLFLFHMALMTLKLPGASSSRGL